MFWEAIWVRATPRSQPGILFCDVPRSPWGWGLAEELLARRGGTVGGGQLVLMAGAIGLAIVGAWLMRQGGAVGDGIFLK